MRFFRSRCVQLKQFLQSTKCYIGEVTTIAGATKENEVGEESTAKFGYLNGIAWSSHDNCLYVCDSGDKAVKKVAMQGVYCLSLSFSPYPFPLLLIK